MNLTDNSLLEMDQETITPFQYSNKFILLVYVQRISGALSIIGSGCIIYSLLRNRKTLCFKKNGEHQTTISTLLLMLSICDFLSSSVGSFMGTWLNPEGVAWQAMGNEASCNIQGFFFHTFAQAASFYNTMQAIYYVLTVCYNIKEKKFRKPLVRFWFLVFPLISVIGYNIWPLVDNAFSYSGRAVCSYEPYPLGCKAENNCTRGKSANTIRLYNTFFIMACAGIIVISVINLWWFVWRTEKALENYLVEGERLNRTRSNEVAIQGMYYAGCFLITYGFWIVFSIRKFLELPVLYWLLVLIHVFIPLQGFLNAFVYFRQNLAEIPARRSLTNFGRKIYARKSIFNSSKLRAPTESHILETNPSTRQFKKEHISNSSGKKNNGNAGSGNDCK